MLVEFRDRGFVKSMIVVTHDLSVLYQIADTIMVMYAGRLAEKAPAATIVESPRHPYTRLLIVSLPEVGVRFAERAARAASPAVRRRCSTRRRAAASATGARSRTTSAASSRRSSSSSHGHHVACWAA